MRIFITQFWFIKHIYKMERPSSGPLGVCFRRLPSGDKGFQDFKKGDQKCGFWYHYFDSSSTCINWKALSGPSRALLSQFPLGDKGFQDFKKDEHKIGILIPQFWLVQHIYKWKDRQVDPLGHSCRSSLRGIKVLRISKKADYHGKIKTSIFASQPHIKMERPSSGPSRALLSQFPSGDKSFYPPKGPCKAEPNGVHMILFPFYCG